jgi:hypothetical protein
MNQFYQLKLWQMLRGIGVSVVTALITAGCASMPAPTEQMAVSKAAINNASSAGGNELAPQPFKSALQKMDAAEQAMAEKDYPRARQLAEEAQVDAQLAAVTARSAKAQKAAFELQEDNRVLQQEIERNAQ